MNLKAGVCLLKLVINKPVHPLTFTHSASSHPVPTPLSPRHLSCQSDEGHSRAERTGFCVMCSFKPHYSECELWAAAAAWPGSSLECRILGPHSRLRRICVSSRSSGDSANDGDFILQNEGSLGAPKNATSLEEKLVPGPLSSTGDRQLTCMSYLCSLQP